MRLLLDTNALLWWLTDDRKLSQSTRAMIADPGNEVLVSVVSLWELIVKVRVGKLKADVQAIELFLPNNGLGRLSITPAHLAVLADLPSHHRDPFDHLLIAQAICEDAVLVSEDQIMSHYAVSLRRCSEG